MCYTSECVSCLNWELYLSSNNKLLKQHNIKIYGLKHNEHRPGSYVMTVSVNSIVTIEACHTTCEVVSISSYMLLDESAL